jgi:hypothetical protein
MYSLTQNDTRGLMEAYAAVHDPEMRANLEEEQNFVEELSLHMIENAAYVLFSQGYDVDDVISYFTEATENTIIEDFVSYSEGRVLLESVVVSDAYISEQFDILNERFAGVGNVLRGAAGFVGKGLQKAGKFLSNKSVPKAGKQLSLPLGQAEKPNLLQRAATGAKELVKKIPGVKKAAEIGGKIAKSPVGRLTGKIGSRVLPGLGVATYGADAVSRAKKGDWGGAALSGLGAVTSAVGGPVASLAPAAIQMGTDALGLTGDKSKKGPTKPTISKPTPPKPTPPKPKPPKPTPTSPSATPATAAAPSKPSTQTAPQKPTGTPMQQWARNFPNLAAKVKPGQSGYGEISQIRTKPGPNEKQNQTPTTGPDIDPKAAQSSVDSAIEAQKKRDREKAEKKKKQLINASYEYGDAFDLVLEYLFSQGHVDTLDEALYVMMEMDSNTIYDICEGYVELNKRRQRRMTDQAMRHMDKGDDDSWEKAYKIEDERDTQTPEVSKAKEQENRNRPKKRSRTVSG